MEQITNKMAGRKELPEDERKIRLIPFIQKKIIDKLGRKECEKIAVEAVVMEYEKLKNRQIMEAKIIIIKDKDGEINFETNGFTNMEIIGLLNYYQDWVKIEALKRNSSTENESQLFNVTVEYKRSKNYGYETIKKEIDKERNASKETR